MLVDNTINYNHPYAFSATVLTDRTDNPTYRDILRFPKEERLLWEEAMVTELHALRKLESFKMVDILSGGSILESTWKFKKKQYPDVGLKKLKSRFCVQGDQQVDRVDVFETYAPVVTWITVRVLLILSIVLNLQTQQVDYTNANFQAPLE